MMLDAARFFDQSYDVPGNFKAKQRRVIHDSSDLVFPKPKKNQQELYQTHYAMNFRSKPTGRPSSPRPCSPTRRNNPHPSKNFLNWRIPTRVFDYGRDKLANVAFLKSNHEDAFQKFYNDYSGFRKTGNGEVDPKLLLEIAKSYAGSNQKPEEKKKPALSQDPGKKLDRERTLPKMLRHSWSPDQAFKLEYFRSSKRRTGKQSFTPIFIKEEFEPVFRSWYEAVSPTERETVKGVIEKAEESYLHKALGATLRPNAIEAIESWLLTANDEEREIAISFIQALLCASEDPDPHNDPHDATERERPLNPVMPVVPPTATRARPAENTYSHYHHKSTKRCDVCERGQLEAELKQLQPAATTSTLIPAFAELLNSRAFDQLETTRHERDARLLQRSRSQPPGGAGNRGSLFVRSKNGRNKDKHFTIHPEWP